MQKKKIYMGPSIFSYQFLVLEAEAELIWKEKKKGENKVWEKQRKGMLNTIESNVIFSQFHTVLRIWSIGCFSGADSAENHIF
jgi:hypothetical protein